MKKILLLLFVAQIALAQNQKQGIQFKQTPVEKVFQEARRAGKPVFVEIFSPTCHVCQSFVPTLADARVGKYYNDKFLSTKLDIGQPSTRTFLDKHHLFVPSLPLFLYFDPQQNLVHFAMSNNSTDEVIRHGTNALSPSGRSQAMKSRYQQGERAPNFLIDYAMYSRVTKDTVANIAAMNEYARQQSPATYANQTNWLALQKLVLDFENPMFQYMLGHLDTYRKAYGAEPTQQVAENILMSSLYSGRGAQYPVAKILEVRQGLTKIGIDPRVAANRTLLPEVNAYFRARQTGKAVERMDSQVASNQLSAPEYIYISRLFNRASPDATDAPTVVKWVNKGLAAKPAPKEQADLYFELAEAYRRGGKSADAQKAAQKSMELAQASRLDTRRNVEQMAKLK
ncbi:MULTISPECIES: thioredoxin family protein [Spirosoma]|uniref:Thioredoxin family protein n=1 Tax=Spirosoma liriopis TaxID=2937440 RepID=A0ABT0HRP0_9BACT|nr:MULTISPECIES: thioredoxin family protein [Spirosoma]MCK8494497.1 thioredoxin family protein [Spirosoma liriopis]UHG89505.1 thioredoxin family protein [Spirosoma oryzicola]